MSHHLKINATLLSIVGSAVGTGVFVIWLASAKAQDIDTAKAEISELKASDKTKTEFLSRLDERTTLILRQLENINSKLNP
jgi:hypothetical protein